MRVRVCVSVCVCARACTVLAVAAVEALVTEALVGGGGGTDIVHAGPVVLARVVHAAIGVDGDGGGRTRPQQALGPAPAAVVVPAVAGDAVDRHLGHAALEAGFQTVAAQGRRGHVSHGPARP